MKNQLVEIKAVINTPYLYTQYIKKRHNKLIEMHTNLNQNHDTLVDLERESDHAVEELKISPEVTEVV